MSNFEETLMKRLTNLEREVERLRVKERPAGGSGVTDHGALTGLDDNDHPQYLLTTGKAADSDKLDGIDSTGFATAGHDHDSDYLGITAKAADSDKLDNIDSTGFVRTSGNQTVAGVKTFSSIPVLPASNPTTSNQAVRKGFADATYLGKSAKAADSDKLDGLDSTDFGRPVFLTTPLTSTSWDGDSFSTTGKTLIDLSAVFGVPAGVKAVLVQLICKDSGSAASNDIYFGVSPNGSSGSVTVISVGRGLPNDTLTYSQGICPCNSNGDIYYQIIASGSNTMDCHLRIWGYWL